MARRETIIEIDDRGQMLTFKIKEMSAIQLERWLIRALLLIAGSGTGVPDGSDLKATGAFLADKGLAALGNIDMDKAQPLLDELLACCARVIENVEERCTPESVGYIQDVKTLFALRTEAVKLNLGFLLPEDASLSGCQE